MVYYDIVAGTLQMQKDSSNILEDVVPERHAAANAAITAILCGDVDGTTAPDLMSPEILYGARLAIVIVPHQLSATRVE